MNKLVTPASAASSVLSENISAVATSLRIANADNFTSSGLASIGNIGSREIVTYSGKSGNKLTGVTRGTNGTVARPFSLGVSVTQPQWVPVIAESDTLATTAELGNITKSSIGLNNVDNTSDANKPVSSATQSALDAKQPILVSGTTIKTVNGTSLLGSGNIAIVGGSVAWGEITGVLANQTDLQTALNLKANSASLGTLATQNGTFSGTSSGTNTGDNATNSQYSGLAASKQDTLVSGTNIKTINGASVLGAGDLVVSVSNAATATALQTPRTINGVSFNGSANIIAGLYARVAGSNVTRTAQTLADITGLSLALAANAVYDVQVCMSVASSSTAGNGYALAYSAAGASVEGQASGTLAAATQKTMRISAFAASQTFVTVAGDGGIWIQAIVTTGANAGNLTVQHLKVTSGTSTVYINSYIRAIRIV